MALLFDDRSFVMSLLGWLDSSGLSGENVVVFSFPPLSFIFWWSFCFEFGSTFDIKLSLSISSGLGFCLTVLSGRYFFKNLSILLDSDSIFFLFYIIY